MPDLKLALFAFFFVTLFAAPAVAQPLTYSAPEIRATVVDEQTGAPISGAVVLAQWRLYVRFAGGGGLIDHQHEFETYTDAAGRFVIPAWGPEIRQPNSELDLAVPQFRIFKAGYFGRSLQNARRLNRQATTVDSEWNGKNIGLRPFDGDWKLYLEELSSMYARRLLECFHTCPKMIVTVDAEWDRITPLVSEEILRRVLRPTPIAKLEPSERQFLEPYLKGKPK